MSVYQWHNYNHLKTRDERLSAYYSAVKRCHSDILKSLVGKKFCWALDIACGYGDSTDLLTDFADNIVGVDSSEVLVTLAKQRAFNVGVQFYCSSFADCDLDGRAFDLISGTWFLNHIHSSQDLDATFQKVVKLLKPRGIITFVIPGDAFTSQRIQRIAREDFNWEQAWTVEEREYTKGIFTYGEEFIRTTIWQPLYLMRLLSAWFDIRCCDVKSKLACENLLPGLVAEPPFEIIYGQLRSSEQLQ